MKLNPDCIRDILLTIEEKSNTKKALKFTSSCNVDRLAPYTIEEICYHFRQCDLKGFLYNASPRGNERGYYVEDLTPKGHEFLENIREDTNWKKTKEIASKVGSFSLDMLKDIAASVISNLINQSVKP